MRAGRAHLAEAYVVVKNGELLLLGAHVTPLSTASTHVHADPVRTRKLLMHREEINRLVGKVERAGYTLTPLNLHFKNGRIKLEVGLAKGKKQHDKRATYACTPALQRPACGPLTERVYLAGDYTYAAYPATLEAAVRSGRTAAQALAREHSA